MADPRASDGTWPRAGLLFVDQRHGYSGVVLELVTPTQAWIDSQLDPAVREVPPTDLWCRLALTNSTRAPSERVMPARCGTVGPVEFEEFLQAVERADPQLLLVLAALMPEHARRAVADALGDREDDHD